MRGIFWPIPARYAAHLAEALPSLGPGDLSRLPAKPRCSPFSRSDHGFPEARVRNAAPAKKQSPLLKDFVDEYLEYYRANRRPRSAKRHETSWHAVQPVLGTKRLDELSPVDLERYRRQRKQAERSEVTINRELA